MASRPGGITARPPRGKERHRFGQPLLVAVCLTAAPLLFHLSTRVSAETNGLRTVAAFVLGHILVPVILFLPGVAAWVVSRRRFGRPSPAVVGGVAAVAALAVAWVQFFVWAITPVGGALLWACGYGASVLVVARAQRCHDVRVGLRTLGALGAVLVGATLLVNGVVFSNGAWTVAGEVAAKATYGTADNLFPAVWAERVIDRADLRAPALNWPPTERPPVQGAAVLPVVAMSGNRQVGYHLAASTLQSLAMVGVALVAYTLGLRRWRLFTAVGLVMLTVFVTFNTVFAWPKLLPAALVLLLAAMMLERENPPVALWATAGVAVALCGLAHVGGLLSLPALLVVWVALRRPWPGWSLLVWLGASALAVMAPWLAWRVLYDPTPAVLVKWHLFGVTDMGDQRSLGQVARDQYGALGWRGWLGQRSANLGTVLGVDRITATDVPVRQRALLTGLFTPALTGGLLVLAAPLLAFRRRLPRAALPLMVGALVCMVGWSVIVFGPPEATTSAHHGPYGAFLLGNVVLAVGVVSVLPRPAAYATLAAQGWLWWWVVESIGAGDVCSYTQLCGTLTPLPSDVGFVAQRPLMLVCAAIGAAAVVVGCRTLPEGSGADRPTVPPE